MRSAAGNLADPVAEEAQAPATGLDVGDGAHVPATASNAGDDPHTPPVSGIGHGTRSASGADNNAHVPEAANPDDRFNQAGHAEAGHAGPAAGGEASRPPGPLTRRAARNHKFGDMSDKALKPYTVPLTAGGLTAGLGIGIYNAVKK